MDALLTDIAAKKAELDSLRPLPKSALENLEHSYDLELTYTSNAIEGDALTQLETNVVIEHGVTVGGKRLKDCVEAIDPHEAIRFVCQIASREKARLAEYDVRRLHALVVQRSHPDIVDRYATSERCLVADSGRRIFPPPAQIPALMGDFAAWLADAPATPEAAFEAHRRLVAIHPFDDGNGRTARLLMNLILMRGGYPPIVVRREDRLRYLTALQEDHAGHGDADFRRLLYERLDAALSEYLDALRQRPRPEAL